MARLRIKRDNPLGRVKYSVGAFYQVLLDDIDISNSLRSCEVIFDLDGVPHARLGLFLDDIEVDADVIVELEGHVKKKDD